VSLIAFVWRCPSAGRIWRSAPLGFTGIGFALARAMRVRWLGMECYRNARARWTSC
jgi:hypothetical protein